MHVHHWRRIYCLNRAIKTVRCYEEHRSEDGEQVASGVTTPINFVLSGFFRGLHLQHHVATKQFGSEPGHDAAVKSRGSTLVFSRSHQQVCSDALLGQFVEPAFDCFGELRQNVLLILPAHVPWQVLAASQNEALQSRALVYDQPITNDHKNYCTRIKSMVFVYMALYIYLPEKIGVN